MDNSPSVTPAREAGYGNVLRRTLIGILLGFLVVLALALMGDLRQVGERFLSFRWRLLPAVLAFTLFNYTLRFVKWHYYLGRVGVQGLSLVESARLFVAGFPLAVTPGKVGEAIKAVWVRDKTGVPVPSGISVVLAERISDGLAVTLLSTIGVIAYPQYWPAFALILATLLGVVVVTQVRPLALTLIAILSKIPLLKKLSAPARDFYESSFAIFRPKATLFAVGLGTVSWLGEGIGMYLILLGLDVPPGWKTFSIAVFALSFSIVVGAASTLPGGLGASEATIAGILSLTLGLGADTSSAATLLIRFATLWFGVSLGLIAWAISPQLFRFKPEKTEQA